MVILLGRLTAALIFFTEVFTMQKQSQHQPTIYRYTNGEVFFKTITCRASVIEHQHIREYCKLRHISMSYYLCAAALYCIDNNIDLLEDKRYEL